MKKTFPLLVLVVFPFLSPTSAHADSILSVSETAQPNPGGPFPFDLPDYPNFVGFSFTLDRSFSNVSITAENMQLVQVLGSAAWLTNSIGPDAAAANVIATTTFSYNVPGHTFVGPITFFDDYGIDLSAGTYYFLISSQGPGFGYWGGGGALGPVIAAPGVTDFSFFWTASEFDCSERPPESSGCNNYAFPPASLWPASTTTTEPFIPFEVDATPVPEPSSIAFLISGLLALASVRRKHKV